MDEQDPVTRPDAHEVAAPVQPTTEAVRTSAERPSSSKLLGSAVLAVVAFTATLILLIGLALLLRPEPSGSAAGASPGDSAGSAAASGPTTPRPTDVAGASAGTPSSVIVDDPVLVGAGDIADCRLGGDEDTAELLDEIDGTVFTVGDNAYERGTEQEFAACYAPTWGRQLARTRPAPGNHDWGTGNLDGYLGYFGEAATGTDGSSWYAYDIGAWRVIVLDTVCGRAGGCDPESEQGRWLAQELASSEARCTVAIFHHPLFTSGEHGPTRDVEPIWEALYAAGADVIVNGHDHDYERFAPQDPTGAADPERGIVEFVVGTGGADLRDFVREAPNSEARTADTHGVLALNLHAESYDWRFVPTSTDFEDEGSASCH